jgi:hypothetical protein
LAKQSTEQFHDTPFLVPLTKDQQPQMSIDNPST